MFVSGCGFSPRDGRRYPESPRRTIPYWLREGNTDGRFGRLGSAPVSPPRIAKGHPALPAVRFGVGVCEAFPRRCRQAGPEPLSALLPNRFLPCLFAEAGARGPLRHQ